jgi:hypothetical protein
MYWLPYLAQKLRSKRYYSDIEQRYCCDGNGDISGTELNADFTQNASIQAPVVDITASGSDVVISSKDNFTLVVKDDRIVVNGNIDLTGTLNSTSVTNVETITTSDNYINLQDGLNQRSDRGGLESRRYSNSNRPRRSFVIVR